MASAPVGIVLADEVDRWPLESEGESDPLSLVRQRTVTFRGRPKIFTASTPTIKGISRVEAACAEASGATAHTVANGLRWRGAHRLAGGPAGGSCRGLRGVRELAR